MLQHLTQVTLRHWDDAMRRLGSRSLRKICELNLLSLGPEVMKDCARLLHSVDTTDIHGDLLSLSELACAFEYSDAMQSGDYRRKVRL